MSRRKLSKGITWFANHESDEGCFIEQDRLGHVFAFFENSFEGVKGDDFAKEALYHGDPTKQIKECRGDLYEGRVSAWHEMDGKFVKIDDENGGVVDVVGTECRYYIVSSPKYYDKR